MAAMPALPPSRTVSAMASPPQLSHNDHPVEVIARIRQYPAAQSCLFPLPNHPILRLISSSGYRDFSLDGTSFCHSENLQAFYQKFVASRVEGVKLGGRCTVMMYGPTGSGKSHTMFGSVQEPGIAYQAFQHILEKDGDSAVSSCDASVKVSVIEIYNEDVYDLLSRDDVAASWKANSARVRLEVMRGKAKNAAFITGFDAGKIARQISNVEKRRVVRSTLCNDRSSRSHCMVTIDVPAVGGRLVLVDMAGSENIHQAGLTMEAKLQTGKINQGNAALKRVVEAIANGDAHIPYRDSKLTVLLQDSFEDDRAKILMVLCASPDPKDFHKTLATLEYGSKAKCIVRLPKSPTREKSTTQDEPGQPMLEARLRALGLVVQKLHRENREKENERNELRNKYLQSQQELKNMKINLAKLEEERNALDAAQLEARKALEQADKRMQEQLELQTIERILGDCEVLIDNCVQDIQLQYDALISVYTREKMLLLARVEGIEAELSSIQHNTATNTEVHPQACCKTPLPSIDEVSCDVVIEPMKGVSLINAGASELLQCNHEHEEKPSFSIHDRCDSQALMGSPNLGGQTYDACFSQLEANSPLLGDWAHADLEQRSLSEDLHSLSSYGKNDNELNEEIRGERAWRVQGQLSEDKEWQKDGESEESYICRDGTLNKEVSFLGSEIGPVYPKPTIPMDVFCSTEKHSFDQVICEDECDREGNVSSSTPHLIDINGGTSKQYQCQDEHFLNWDDKPSFSLLNHSEREESMTDSGHREGYTGVDRPLIGDWAHANLCVKEDPYSLSFYVNNDNEQSEKFRGGRAWRVQCKLSVNSEHKEWQEEEDGESEESDTSRDGTSETGGVYATPTIPRDVFGNTQKHPSDQVICEDECEPIRDVSISKPRLIALAHTERQGSKAEATLDMCDVYAKWETSKDSLGDLIKIISIKKMASLANLRALLEPVVPQVKQHFIFLMLGEPGGAPVSRSLETELHVASLPACNNRGENRLACLRPPPRRKLLPPPERCLHLLDKQTPLVANPSNPSTSKSKQVQKQAPVVRGLRVKNGLGKCLPTFKENARKVFGEELTARFLH